MGVNINIVPLIMVSVLSIVGIGSEYVYFKES